MKIKEVKPEYELDEVSFLRKVNSIMKANPSSYPLSGSPGM